ncbi:MAG: phosphatidylglycerophosphatase A [Candidatus Omnitrophota bacterium]
MKKHKKNIHDLISTVFGLGYVPGAPGTLGSLAGLILCIVLHPFAGLYITTFIILFILGVISAAIMEKKSRQKDPPFIIIDEFVNIFPVFLFVPITFFSVIMGFILYRFFYITKIYPIKKLEKIKNGWGIMLDDLLSAVYANIALHLILFFYSI